MESINKEKAGKFAESIKSRIGSDSKAGNFFASVKNRMGVGSPEQNAADTYERGMKITPDCISAIENETPVKQYNIAVLRTLLKFERAEGRMQVTNKRVIFRASGRSVGGRTTLQHEYDINEVGGIEARKNYKFSFLYLVFAIIIIALASFITSGPSAFSGITSLVSSKGEDVLEILDLEGTNSEILILGHLYNAYNNEKKAISERKKAEENAVKAMEAREAIQNLVTEYEGNAVTNPTRTYLYGRRYLTPQAILDLAIPERDKAIEGEKTAIAEFETAKKAEKKTVNSRVFAQISLTILGLIFGFGGLILFFVLYKRFGLKLFILIFGNAGFTVCKVATGIFIFGWLFVISVIATIVCVFLFCFRPNLIISIKNKAGKREPIDISRKGTGFSEVIPTEETESAIREIGAIICDFQKSGDSALDKWNKRENRPSQPSVSEQPSYNPPPNFGNV
ncbi:MAG: hypothetical protein LBI28_07730 [Treponema sp.]|jgi:hypothetical protein|nr:hypothetical protein [Treponema sp.]